MMIVQQPCGIGPVVNLAARLQGAANPGEIVVTEEVFKYVKEDFPGSISTMITLKDIEEPVQSYVILHA